MDFFKWEHGAPTRIGLRAALASAATGLLLAAFQVQGWTIPTALALALIGLLVTMIVVTVLSIVLEALRALRNALEHRATTAAWVPLDEPGFLDYEPDGIRANKRFAR